MNRKQKREKQVLGIVFFLFALVFLYSGIKILDSTVFLQKENEMVPVTSKTITRDGTEYFPRQDMTVLMVMGIDQNGVVKDSGSYNNSGAVDAVILLVFTEKDESVRVLTLNRDTMVDIPVLGVGGKPAGTIHGQLALSHTYGNGLEESCENTMQTVSDLLYGLRIDYYVSMNMDAIAILNDAVGGVQVTVTDDFSGIDPSIVQGEITLRGEQATTFVRSRSGLGDELNVSRMERQKEYVDGFLSALKEKAAVDDGFILQTYNDVADYMVTNCSSTVWSTLLKRYRDYTLQEVVIPEGKNVKGDKYMEFYLDEEALDDVILRLFYSPKKR